MSNRKKKTIEIDSSDKAIRTTDPPDAKTISKTEQVMTLPKDNAVSFAENERAVRPKRSTNEDLYSKTERMLDDDDILNELQIPREKSTNKQKSKLVKVVNAISALKRSKSIGKSQRKKSGKRGMTRSDCAIRTEPPKQNQQSKTEMNLSSVNENRESFKDNEVAIKTAPPNVAGADKSRTELSTSEKLKNKRRKLKPNKKYAVKDSKKRRKPKKKSFDGEIGSSDKALRTPPLDRNMLNLSRTENNLDEFPNGKNKVKVVDYNVLEQDQMVAHVKNIPNVPPNNVPVPEGDKSITQKQWFKIVFGLAVFVYSIVFLFQMWRLFKALAATYEVSIDDCQMANSLCHRYSMCCFNQCGANRIEKFWSKLLNG